MVALSNTSEERNISVNTAMDGQISCKEGSNISMTDESSYESDENLFNDIMKIADSVENSMSLVDKLPNDEVVTNLTDQKTMSNAIDCSSSSNDSFDNEEDGGLGSQHSSQFDLSSNCSQLGLESAETDSLSSSLELSEKGGNSPLSSKSSSVSSTTNEEKQRLYRLLSAEKETRLPIHTGFLMKIGGTGLTPKNWRKRWFVLRSDNCLYYYKNPKGKPAGGIVLSKYLVTPVMGNSSKNFSFQLTKGGARTYTLAAFSATEMRTWMQVISEASKADSTLHSTPDYSIHNISMPALSIKDPDCHGYIWKQGQVHKTWKRRYAVLKDGSLFYYKDMSETTAIGVFCLHCYSVNETESISRKYGIVAIPPQPMMRTYYFATENENDRDRWLKALKNSIDFADCM